jgi:F-box protein 18 (helicase)
VAAVADPFLRKFASFDLLQDYAEAVQDRELLARIGIVEKYEQRIPELVARAKAAHVPAAVAALELSTAHRAKGLEWDRVRLGDDFPELLSESGVPRTRRYLDLLSGEAELLPQEEANLFYVSATRARCVLEQNAQLGEFLDWCRTQREARERPPLAAQASAG